MVIKPSPRTVLDAVEGESISTEDDSSRFGGSTMSGSPPQAPKFKGQSCIKKQMSPYKFISSFFSSPLRKRKVGLSNTGKEQPLMKCFSYEEISNATNNFHSGKNQNTVTSQKSVIFYIFTARHFFMKSRCLNSRFL